jgi:inner membrane protein involved in colicin E2 resistance
MAQMIMQQDEEDQVQATSQLLGVSMAEARFIVAINRGEIDGGEVEVEPGQELPE